MNILKLTDAFVTKRNAVVLLAVCVLAFYVGVDWQKHSSLALGVYYSYHWENTGTINSDLEAMKKDGFRIVAIPFVWHPDAKDPNRIRTDVLLEKAKLLGLEVYVREAWPQEALEQYLAVYGDQISYVQVINEADARMVAELRVPGEIACTAITKHQITKKANPNIKTVATFVTPLVPTLLRDIGLHVDIIALDIYENIQLNTFPIQLQMLLTLTNKHTIWIGEFNLATLNDQEQANFIVKGLNLFNKNGVEAVIIFGWNLDEGSGLTIKGRQAETAIAQWTRQP